MASDLPIFFLSDFGARDPYAGLMKAVVLGLGHSGALVDLTHGIPHGDLLAGAMALEDAFPFLPRECVVCAVVDPGVGTLRRAMAVQVGGRFLVGPDNGLLSPFVEMSGAVCVEILPRAEIDPSRSSTFHGRDVFAPAAGLLAMGQVTLEGLGPPMGDVVLLDESFRGPMRLESGVVELTILAVDHFGNLTTNARRWGAGDAFDGGTLMVGGQEIHGLRRAYGEVERGALLVYWNSANRLEIAVNGRSAAVELGVGRGERVRFVPAGTP